MICAAINLIECETEITSSSNN